MADSNLVILLVKLNPGLKSDYSSKTKERKDMKNKNIMFL
jgi:hypothetical protein